MKRLLAVAAALVLLLLPLAALAGSPQESTKSIARVYVSTRTEYDIIGSAFAVGKSGEKVQYFVTNKHVVAGRNSVFLCLGDAMSMLHATVVDSWDSPDLAVLKLDSPSNEWKPAAIKHTSLAKVGERIYTLSFPSGADMTYTLKSNASDVTVTEGIISSKDVDVNGFKSLRISANISGGSSGGAVVTEDGAVIGVCFGGVEAGYNYAVNSDYVLSALKTLGIPYITAGSANLTLVLIIAGAIVLIGVIVALILVLRKRPAAVGASYAAGAGPVVYGGAPRSAAPSAALSLTCIEGPLKGRRYTLNSSLLLGRDTNCDVVFPANTPGVSGRHCSLRSDGRYATLTDHGSTCGTILFNGTKLGGGASYSLQRGDTFYLGSKAIGFMLE